MEPKTEPRHTISVWVDNTPGVLSRVTGLFSGRGFNIESLCVAETMDPEVSRITIVSTGDEQITEQIIKQLHKLIPVLRVYEHADLVEKEMALVKFPIAENLSEIETLCNAYNGKIVNVGNDMIIAMVADEPKRVLHYLEAIKRFHPKEIVRSGTVALER